MKKRKRRGTRILALIVFLGAVVIWDRVMPNKAPREKRIQEQLQELFERNEEAREFVADYENRGEYLGLEPDISKEVTEGEVPLFLQWDKRWGYQSFGRSNVGLAGCGPTCLAMAYVYFTGDVEGHPGKMAAFCEEERYYTSQGTDWSFWTEGAKDWGLIGEELPLDEVRMKAALDEGDLVVCSMRPGDFTTTGHYILIVGYEEGGFRIHDPNRRSNSEKLWNYDALKNQIRNLWSLGK